MIHAFIRDSLSIPTWLILGASIQSVLLLVLPQRYIITPIIFALLYIITRTVLQSLKWVSYRSSPSPIMGRYTAMPPLSLAEGEPQSMVVFILGFDSHHPLGKFGPGLREFGQLFNDIIEEAEANRSTSGYLGSSGPLLTMDGDNHNALLTITYWRSYEELEAFNKQGAHLRSVQWWNANTKRYPHIGKYFDHYFYYELMIGIMHEMYNVPAGQHENISMNYRPFGIAKTSYVVDGQLGEQEVIKAEIVRDGQGLESMQARMKRGLKGEKE